MKDGRYRYPSETLLYAWRASRNRSDKTMPAPHKSFSVSLMILGSYEWPWLDGIINVLQQQSNQIAWKIVFKTHYIVHLLFKHLSLSHHKRQCGEVFFFQKRILLLKFLLLFISKTLFLAVNGIIQSFLNHSSNGNPQVSQSSSQAPAVG